MSEMNWRSQEGGGEGHHVPFQAKMTGPCSSPPPIYLLIADTENGLCYGPPVML